MSSNLNPNESTRKLNLKEVRRIFLQLYPSVASQSAASWSIGGGSGFSSLLENFAEKVGFRSGRSSFVWKSRKLNMMRLIVTDIIWWQILCLSFGWGVKGTWMFVVAGRWRRISQAHLFYYLTAFCADRLQLINCTNGRTCICTALHLSGSNQSALGWNTVSIRPFILQLLRALRLNFF